MSVRKFCSPALPGEHPLHCSSSSQCEHHWFYDFRVNQKRYRQTTETPNKQLAKSIEAKERSRVLEGRHQIRRQPDITFRAFAETYIRDHATVNKRSVERDEQILLTLNRAFGSLILHEITAHRIEQFKRDRLTGKWRGHGYKTAPKPLKPGTVNRELDCLRGILSKAVKWGKLLDSPVRTVKRLKVDNRWTRILTEDEQIRLLNACPLKLRRMVRLALIMGCRLGELLALRWDDIGEAELTFLETKNGRSRRIPVSPAIKAVLDQCPKTRSPWVFTNARTHEAYTVNGVAHTFRRALKRAGITTGDVSLHTLRHTAISRMIAMGIDDFTVMAISGHRSVRMLERYTHPTTARKLEALTVDLDGQNLGRTENDDSKEAGGRREARTRDLRIANAALSQLS